MAAVSFQAATMVLPGRPDSCSADGTQLRHSVSYHLDLGDQIETISTNGVDKSNGLMSLLYVPHFPSGHPCGKETKDMIPSNVTHRADLPAHECHPVALAPWVSEKCILSFLDLAAEQDALAFVFYKHDNSTDLLPANDKIWQLDDSGWKSDYDFPIYAIPGSGGQELMDGLVDYSGDLSEVPNSDELHLEFEADSYVRIYASVDFEGRQGAHVPDLWVFLLAIIGILVFIMLSSSMGMRIIQTRRRRSLHRRIAAGEVDIEMLGIKRLRVPQHHLDKMPIYTYAADGHPVTPAPNSTTAPFALQSAEHVKSTPRDIISRWLGKGSSGDPETTPQTQVDRQVSTSESQAPPLNVSDQEYGELVFSQLTCPICLDDYVVGESTVRELPCRHIFHPECIDTFLLQNSSLCPVCKKSVLPPGYFPVKITDIMVRQERFARSVQRHNIRRGRDISLVAPELQPPAQSYPARQRMTQPRGGLRTTLMTQLRSSRNPDHHTDQSNAAGPPSDSQPVPPSQTTGQTDLERREEMRRRAIAMLGSERMAEDEVRDRDDSRPKWLKFVHKVFPPLR